MKEVILIKLKQQTKTLNEFLNIKNIKDYYLYTLDGQVMLFMKIFPINTEPVSDDTFKQIRMFASKIKDVKKRKYTRIAVYAILLFCGACMVDIIVRG